MGFTNIGSVNFTLINRLILVVILIVSGLFIFDLYFSASNIYRPLTSLETKFKTISLKEKETKPYSYYEQEISKRDLFQSGPLKPKYKKVIPAGLTFKELIKNLHLLGIVSGEKLQVIIEDKKLRKTYFLYVGDYLGEVKVEGIHSESVILEYKGERVSLFL